jgi:hypothetical protein
MYLEESRPGQRTIAKKTLDAWDDVIRPDGIIICTDWPTILKWDTAFEYIKGNEGKNDRRTTDERQTRDTRTEGVRNDAYQKVEESRVAKLQSQPAYRQRLYLCEDESKSFFTCCSISLRCRKHITFNNIIKGYKYPLHI